MATSETTTLRVPTSLRDEIAQIARSRDTSMVDVVAEAVAHLRREQWWVGVHESLDSLADDETPASSIETADYDGTLADGLS